MKHPALSKVVLSFEDTQAVAYTIKLFTTTIYSYLFKLECLSLTVTSVLGLIFAGG